MAMTKDKRVAIAKDVLSRLRKKKLLVKAGRYISREDVYSPLEGIPVTKFNLQQHVDKVEGQCQVCALGATVLSKARLFDDVVVEEDRSGRSIVGCRLNELAEIHAVNRIFGKKQARLIEAYFEGVDTNDLFVKGDENPTERRAEAWVRQNPDPEKRLRLLMNNVVKNEGVFKPERLQVKAVA